MRRADRLFEIIQLLRRKDLLRARELGGALEVSERTIYRDIQDLIASGVPIAGEAGVGYVLKAGFDLPPLMFKEQEIEALVLGARIVESWADPELSAAASDVLAKIEAVIPDRLRDYMANTALLAPSHHYMEAISSTSPRCGGRCASSARCISSTKMRPEMPRKEPFGRCPWRISDRSGCSPAGASSDRLPHLPPRPDRRVPGRGRALPGRARPHPERFPQARA